MVGILVALARRRGSGRRRQAPKDSNLPGGDILMDLRVLHYVPVIDAANSFGGPATVALRLAEESKGAGIAAEVVGACGDARPLRSEIAATSGAKLFAGRYLGKRLPTRLVSSSLLWWMLRHVRRFRLWHVHGFREPATLLTMFLAVLIRVPFIVQTHGMLEVSKDRGRLSVLICGFLLRRARWCLCLTEAEVAIAQDKYGVANASKFLNPVQELVPDDEVKRIDNRIIFCSRLHPRKRLGLFLGAVAHLVEEGRDLDPVVIGADEGDYGLLAEFQERHPGVVRYIGAVPPRVSLAEIAKSAVLVAPAADEPFGMNVVEALAEGTIVVGTAGLALANQLEREGAALIVPADVAQIASAVGAALDDQALARNLRNQGRHWVAMNLSSSKLIEQLIETYRFAVGITK